MDIVDIRSSYYLEDVATEFWVQASELDCACHNTKPEILVRKFLHPNGYRYGLHDKTLPANPILPACSQTVLLKYKTVIFVQNIAAGAAGHDRG